MALNLNDESTNSNTLTNNGAVEATSGLPFAQSTSAADFESADSDYMEAADSTSLSITGDFTMEFWVKLESQPATDTVMGLVQKITSTGNQRSYGSLYRDISGTQYIELQTSQDGTTGTRTIIRWTQTLTTGTWYHIAITYDVSQATATEAELFLGGSSQGNGTVAADGSVASIYDSTSKLWLGALDGAGSFLDGVLDEIRIWNDIRTGTEISDNMSIELTNPTAEANLVAYYPFESDLGPIAAAKGLPFLIY